MEPKAKRCSTCSVNYPPTMEVCRICDGELWPLFREEAEPDYDWEQRVEAAVGIDPASIYPHPPDGRCTRFKHEGRLWFKHDDLTALGYRHLEDGSIVYVNGIFHELVLYWPQEDAWWVVEVPHEGVFDNVSPEDAEAD